MFDTNVKFDFVSDECGTEPTLRTIIEYYYSQCCEVDKAKEFAALYIDLLKAAAPGIDLEQFRDAAWREGWALAYSGPSNLYGDDGELQDNSSIPCIDWRRDSAEVIRDKITERGNRLIAAMQATSAEVTNA